MWFHVRHYAVVTLSSSRKYNVIEMGGLLQVLHSTSNLYSAVSNTLIIWYTIKPKTIVNNRLNS